MIKFLKNTALISAILLALRGLGGVVNNLAIWDYLTQFFVLIRKVVAPLDFIWSFDTSFEIITIILGILIAYSSLQAFVIIRDNYK